MGYQPILLAAAVLVASLIVYRLLKALIVSASKILIFLIAVALVLGAFFWAFPEYQKKLLPRQDRSGHSPSEDRHPPPDKGRPSRAL